ADRVRSPTRSKQFSSDLRRRKRSVTNDGGREMRRAMSASLAVALAVMVGAVTGANAQPEIGRQVAPTGKLRGGALILSYFPNEDSGTMKGWSPELGIELARRAGVPHELVPIHNPADMIEAFKNGRIDVTFIGITRDRSAAFDFGPVLIGLRT